MSLIDRLLNKTEKKRIADDEYLAVYPKKVLQIEHPQSFRGHSAEVGIQGAYNAAKKGLIYVNQRYLGGSVNQQFNIETNETYTSYTVTAGKTPKWLKAKIDELGEYLFCGKIHMQKDYQLMLQENPKVDIWSGMSAASYAINEKGCCFNNHFENINEIKRLSKMLRTFKLKIKSSSVQKLAEHSVLNADGNVIQISKNILK